MTSEVVFDITQESPPLLFPQGMANGSAQLPASAGTS